MWFWERGEHFSHVTHSLCPALYFKFLYKDGYDNINNISSFQFWLIPVQRRNNVSHTLHIHADELLPRCRRQLDYSPPNCIICIKMCFMQIINVKWPRTASLMDAVVPLHCVTTKEHLINCEEAKCPLRKPNNTSTNTARSPSRGTHRNRWLIRTKEVLVQ